KLVGINGHALELPIEKHHVVMLYTDRPGIVAVYGQKFGEAGVNIAGMQISRLGAGDQALSVVTLDSPISDELLDEVSSAIDADLFRQIEITEVCGGGDPTE
ncbi:phosphoglycerate dehydrogenase, partial [Pseudomonas sp. BGM005]|nr:phosphoglycerate dehydrogenase [Pseudomonas sp. BG5]